MCVTYLQIDIGLMFCPFTNQNSSLMMYVCENQINWRNSVDGTTCTGAKVHVSQMLDLRHFNDISMLLLVQGALYVLISFRCR